MTRRPVFFFSFIANRIQILLTLILTCGCKLSKRVQTDEMASITMKHHITSTENRNETKVRRSKRFKAEERVPPTTTTTHVAPSNGEYNHTNEKKKLILNGFVMNTPGHLSPGLWKHPRNKTADYKKLKFWTDLAQLLDNAGFHAMFVADVLGPSVFPTLLKDTLYICDELSKCRRSLWPEIESWLIFTILT